MPGRNNQLPQVRQNMHGAQNNQRDPGLPLSPDAQAVAQHHQEMRDFFPPRHSEGDNEDVKYNNNGDVIMKGQKPPNQSDAMNIEEPPHGNAHNGQPSNNNGIAGGRRTRSTRCWRRARSNGTRYTVCNKSNGQKGMRKSAKKGRKSVKKGGKRKHTKKGGGHCTKK